MSNVYDIPRAESPKNVGVSAKVVKDFLNDAVKQGYELHSLMVIRHGKVAVEWYNEPYNKDTPQSVYSISKSFTSTAIGFAISEGLISLDTNLVDIFPDYPPKKADERFEKLTVRNLLRMSSGKQPSFLSDKSKIDWIEDYINSPWVFEPGEKFLYINENIFMLSAIINRVTGMSMREYLEPRLFKPLGIDFPFWETDRNGIEAGGWGLYIKTEDIAKLALCYQQKGKYNDVQVIPEEWTVEATKKQIDNEYNRPGTDASFGYGYCFWKNSIDEDSFRADGMFSQFGIGIPQYDATVVLTSAVTDETGCLEFLFKYFPKAFQETDEEIETVENTMVEHLVTSDRSPMEDVIKDRYIKFRKKILLNLTGFQLSVLPMAVTYMLTDKPGNIDMVKFDFNDKECTMKWSEGLETNTIVIGLDGRYRYSKITLGNIDFTVCANAIWLDNESFLVTIRPIQTVAKRNLIFEFHPKDKVVMIPSSSPSGAEILNNLTGFFEQMIPNKTILNLFNKIMTFAPKLMEPKHYGKFIEK
ncbi:MAG: serine hydrolase [Clostridia bacterium]|nr:serine hydrolase [Clostridia bacterium]